MQCPHVDSSSMRQPALVVVQLLRDPACRLLLHFKCDRSPSSLGLHPVLELVAGQPTLQQVNGKIACELELMELRQIELLLQDCLRGRERLEL